MLGVFQRLKQVRVLKRRRSYDYMADERARTTYAEARIRARSPLLDIEKQSGRFSKEYRSQLLEVLFTVISSRDWKEAEELCSLLRHIDAELLQAGKLSRLERLECCIKCSEVEQEADFERGASHLGRAMDFALELPFDKSLARRVVFQVLSMAAGWQAKASYFRAFNDLPIAFPESLLILLYKIKLDAHLWPCCILDEHERAQINIEKATVDELNGIFMFFKFPPIEEQKRRSTLESIAKCSLAGNATHVAMFIS